MARMQWRSPDLRHDASNLHFGDQCTHYFARDCESEACVLALIAAQDAAAIVLRAVMQQPRWRCRRKGVRSSKGPISGKLPSAGAVSVVLPTAQAVTCGEVLITPADL